MRIAALYDIHGNLPALEAVLADVRRVSVDEIVVGGDVAPGPMARESLRCLLQLEIPTRFIRGNGETAILAEMRGADPGGDARPILARVVASRPAERNRRTGDEQMGALFGGSR